MLIILESCFMHSSSISIQSFLCVNFYCSFRYVRRYTLLRLFVQACCRLASGTYPTLPLRHFSVLSDQLMFFVNNLSIIRILYIVAIAQSELLTLSMTMILIFIKYEKLAMKNATKSKNIPKPDSTPFIFLHKHNKMRNLHKAHKLHHFSINKYSSNVNG